MSTKDDEFLRQLRATFKVEADEHLQAIETGLLNLEKTPASSDLQRDIVEKVFRAAHSLKGAARAVDLGEVESHCQRLEEVLASWKRRETVPTPEALDKLLRILVAVKANLSAPAAAAGADMKAQASPRRPPPAPGASPRPASASVVADQPTAAIADHPASAETVRVPVAKLEARLLESEELLAAKLAAAQRVNDLRQLSGRLEDWRKAWSAVEPEARRLARRGGPASSTPESPVSSASLRLLDFFDWSLDYFKSLEGFAATLGRSAEQDRQAVGKLVDDLLEDAKKLLLLPFATITAPLPKLVRDLCRDQGKEAELVIRGEQVEIDKRILEEMKDPLVHFLRNCIDHGVEMPDERVRRGKPARATITLAVTQINGSKVQLLLSDDGAGIDAEKVKLSAIKHGLISAQDAERLGEAEAQALIFQSAVSTSRIVTQLSGRGLGLAIVREKTEKLGGEVSVESRLGEGTLFRVVVPATRATFRGLLVEAAGQVLVVPTAQVERVTRARDDDIRTVEGRDTISYEGRAIALLQLADVLELPPVAAAAASRGGAAVIVLGSGDQSVGFCVDAVLDELEVLVKPLRKPLSRVRNIAAATVLGSGQVVPILNVSDLLKSARRHSGATVRSAGVPAPVPVQARRILVVEDSITSRMLLKTILESAGYFVKVAVDGIEGFTMLRTEQFDLVVSDVEMPRLNGFDLTARIRAEAKFADLPVVLVTALDTREDRERGIDVGANAYIVKGSFDQSNLLEAVRRLI